MKGRLVVIGAGLLAVLALATVVRHQTPNPVRIKFVSSPEKKQLMRSLVERFNAASGARVGGRPVSVELQIANSGDAQTRIASGELRPVVWSPASSLWGLLLNFEAGKRLVPEETRSIVRTPLVIAVWEPMARALGWPARRISWRQILELATSEEGLAAHGKPDLDPFKLGHPNPDVSTSGLSALVAEYHVEAGNPSQLDEREIETPRVKKAIREIEQSVVHPGDTTLSFSKQLKRHGSDYASAVPMEETTLVGINRARRTPKLVPIYPAEGTFVSDNPFILLSAPWVSPTERSAARLLEHWLLAHVTPALAASEGFRTSKRQARPPRPLDRANGIDPTEPQRELPVPSPKVLATIKNYWRLNRKPANVMLVVDTSSSMRKGGKLDAAKRALQAFLNSLSPRDRVGLISFSDQVLPGSPLALLDQQGRARLKDAVRGLEAGGEDALYDATDRAVRDVEHVAEPTRINAVVVLADGGDNRSSVSLSTVVSQLGRQSRRRLGVNVYTIAYGRDAYRGVLEQLAARSQGYAFRADPSTIEARYRTIASYL